ncbi:hypothetical protein [Nocardia sp. R7R-8]|uniref:hypothetical protein n=1 Tax=Nocardia sp. R7R-8 TaxID=3459304 RepID=UPI00403E0D56
MNSLLASDESSHVSASSCPPTAACERATTHSTTGVRRDDLALICRRWLGNNVTDARLRLVRGDDRAAASPRASLRRRTGRANVDLLLRRELPCFCVDYRPDLDAVRGNIVP